LTFRVPRGKKEKEKSWRKIYVPALRKEKKRKKEGGLYCHSSSIMTTSTEKGEEKKRQAGPDSRSGVSPERKEKGGETLSGTPQIFTDNVATECWGGKRGKGGEGGQLRQE